MDRARFRDPSLYFRHGSRRPFRALTAAHAQAVPFRNLDVLLGRPLSLDLPSLERKLVRQRRGVADGARCLPPAGTGALELQPASEDGWLPMYRSSGATQESADYEMASYYVSNAPESAFRQKLMMAREEVVTHPNDCAC